MANSRDQGSDGMEDDSDEHRKRPREEDDSETPSKRRSKREEETEGVGGIRKLVEFCSKDIK